MAPLLQQEDPRHLLGQTRVLDRNAVVVGHEPGVRLDIGAIDVKDGKRCREVGFERQLGGELRGLVLESRPCLLELRLGCELIERPLLTD